MSNEDFEQIWPAVRSHVLSQIKHSDAEDIFQEVSFRAYGKAADFKNEEDVIRYCYSAVAQELRRDLARDVERRQTDREVGQLTPSTVSNDVDYRINLEQACKDLSDELKEAVWEVLYDGATTRETELAQSTVSRAVVKVKERLKEAA
jgi:DNA-directed RNA polymerase specialized sigma24 family protein